MVFYTYSSKAIIAAALILGIFFVCEPQLAMAQQYSSRYASVERTSAARGHYARARALLVEALAEFEQGRRLARPDMLIDSEEWRISLISRTEELNKVLDPQPRVTRSGTRFRANAFQVRRKRNAPPPVRDGAHYSNTHGEEQRPPEVRVLEQKRRSQIGTTREDSVVLSNPNELPKSKISSGTRAIENVANQAEPQSVEESFREEFESNAPEEDKNSYGEGVTIEADAQEEVNNNSDSEEVGFNSEEVVSNPPEGDLSVSEKDAAWADAVEEAIRQRIENNSE